MIIVVNGGMNIIIRKVELLFLERPQLYIGRMISARKFVIVSSPIEELKEYAYLGICKNYCGSFATNTDENIT